MLNPDTGYIVCESSIDAQPFQNVMYRNEEFDTYYQGVNSSVYANDYAASSVRSWLNADFYDTAFTAGQKAKIKKNALNNDGYEHRYDSAATNDELFLLSWDDAKNSAYGFSSLMGNQPERQAKGTDYARCQGLLNFADNYSFWWMRSGGYQSCDASYVNNLGAMLTDYADVTETSVGVRPACRLSVLEWDTAQSTSLYSEGVGSAVMNAQLNVPQSATVEHKAKVTVTATATGVPAGFTVAIYEGEKLLQNGDNKTVSCNAGKMKVSKTFTVRVIDPDGQVQSNADGKLEKQITVTVKTGFFDKIKSFFLRLFGLLPAAELKP